jgi:hypothetical protein
VVDQFTILANPSGGRVTTTTYGLRVAFFYAKLYLRILRPQWAALLPLEDQLLRPLRTALDQLGAQTRPIRIPPAAVLWCVDITATSAGRRFD